MERDKGMSFEEKVRQCWPTPPIPVGDEARFNARLQRVATGRRRKMTRLWLAAASVAAALVVLVSTWTRDENPVLTDGYADQINAVKLYYESKQWEEAEYIAILAEDVPDELREQVMAEVDRVRREADVSAREVLASLLSGDQKIYRLITVYTSTSSVLTQMHEMLGDMHTMQERTER